MHSGGFLVKVSAKQMEQETAVPSYPLHIKSIDDDDGDKDTEMWMSRDGDEEGATPSNYAQSEIYAKFSYWAQGHTRKFSKLHLASKIAASMHECACLLLLACVCKCVCVAETALFA